MPRRVKYCEPGVGEGHPDDRPGPTYESVKEALKECLADCASAGLSLIVGLSRPQTVGPFGIVGDPVNYVNSVGDVIGLVGVAELMKQMAVQDMVNAASPQYIECEDGDDSDDDDDDGEGEEAET